MFKVFCFFTLAIYAATSHGMDATLMKKDNGYSIRLQNIDYPKTLAEDLISGLSTEVLIQSSLTYGDELVDSTTLHISVKYDLWDEQFHFQTLVNQDSPSITQFPDQATVLGALNRVDIPLTQRLALYQGQSSLVLSIRLLLNPIERERLKLIRDFVAENSAPGSASARNSESNRLFTLIFNQYTDGVELGAIWQTSITMEIKP